MKATHKKMWWTVKTGKSEVEVEIFPGQFIYGRNSAAKELRMKLSTVRNRIEKLKNIGNLDIKKDNQYSTISIVNWDIYQSEEKKEDSKEDNQRTTKGQSKDTYKNKENIKNILTGKSALDFFAPDLRGWDKVSFEKSIDGFIFMRKTKAVSSGVIEKEIEYWNKFPDKIINQALAIYTTSRFWEKDKGEKYLRGIIRGKMKDHEKLSSQSLSKKAF
jgi:hypothetical protein